MEASSLFSALRGFYARFENFPLFLLDIWPQTEYIRISFWSRGQEQMKRKNPIWNGRLRLGCDTVNICVVWMCCDDEVFVGE